MTDALREAAQAVVGECEEWTVHQHGEPAQIIRRVEGILRASLAAPAPGQALDERCDWRLRCQHDAGHAGHHMVNPIRWERLDFMDDRGKPYPAPAPAPAPALPHPGHPEGQWACAESCFAAPAPAPALFADGCTTVEWHEAHTSVLGPAPAPALDRERLARALMRLTQDEPGILSDADAHNTPQIVWPTARAIADAYEENR